jgi:hypothetical protein
MRLAHSLSVDKHWIVREKIFPIADIKASTVANTPRPTATDVVVREIFEIFFHGRAFTLISLRESVILLTFWRFSIRYKEILPVYTK